MFVEARTVALLWPEIVLILAATAIFVGGAFRRARAWWVVVSLVSYVAAGVALWMSGSPLATEVQMSGPVTTDAMSALLRWIALLSGFVMTLTVSRLTDKELASEFLGTLMLAVAGAMITSVANELVLLFLGLELISIPTYVLLFLGRRDQASAEATMKYFFLSIFSSALLLYGISFLYGITGTTLISGNGKAEGIRERFTQAVAASTAAANSANAKTEQVALQADDLPPAAEVSEAPATSAGNILSSLGVLAPLALVLIIAGLSFKLAAAPFQFYAPDVYQGTTNANASVLAILPKIAGVAGLVRLLVMAMPAVSDFAWQLALVLAIITMTIGNICALWQRNVRRMMAYSSIAHTGYILIGLAVASSVSALDSTQAAGGVAAMLFYLFVYVLATMGTFSALAYLGSERKELNTLDDLAGIGQIHPLAAGSIAVFMFSLAGIPPLAGFWGKLTIFGSAIEMATSDVPGNVAVWFTVLAVAGVLNAAISAAYYLRIISVMFFQASTATPAAGGGRGALAAAVICAVLVLGAGILPGAPMGVAVRAEKQIHTEAEEVVRTIATTIAPKVVRVER